MDQQDPIGELGGVSLYGLEGKMEGGWDVLRL